MKLALAALALLAASVPSWAQFEGIDTRPLAFQKGARVEGAVPGRALCEQKPLIARAELRDDLFYMRHAAEFDVAGMRLHVSGNKDASKGKTDGWYFAVMVDGDDTVYWIRASRGRVDKTIHGRVFHFQVALGLKGAFVHEYIKLKISDDAGFSRDLTMGAVAFDAYRFSPKIRLFGQDFYVDYTRNISAQGDTASWLQTHAVTIKNFQQEDGGKTYKADELNLFFLAESIERAPSVRTLFNKTYGFRIKRGALEVLDFTGSSIPACP